MNVESERSKSLWSEVRREKAPPLSDKIRTKVLVIGAGIAGLSTAYELARRGTDVVVVDRGPIAGGMTARTSAHLSYQIDDFYYALIEKAAASSRRRSRPRPGWDLPAWPGPMRPWRAKPGGACAFPIRRAFTR
jgi:glycine/D-amino acid oxidase-like deaminating enzyme